MPGNEQLAREIIAKAMREGKDPARELSRAQLLECSGWRHAALAIKAIGFGGQSGWKAATPLAMRDEIVTFLMDVAKVEEEGKPSRW